jgi:allantoate deiminase
VLEEFRRIATRRGVGLGWQVTSETAATPCSPRLVALISHAIASIGFPAPLLASGAGHDGIAMSTITEIGMVFMRCAGGISHHPAESITPEDLDLGIEALFRCCLSFAGTHERTLNVS